MRREFRGPGGTLALKEGDDAALDLAMLIEGETSGRPLDDVLAEFNRARTTYYEKLRRFRTEGLHGLLARTSGPQAPWRRTNDVIRFIVTARLRNPNRSAAAIAEDLRRAGVVVGVRTVERTLAEFELTGRSGSSAKGELGS